MPTFPVPSGTFTGMSQQQLQAALAQAQQALLDLEMGGKPVSVSYSQGDGARSASFSAANADRLRQLIRQLAAALGLGQPRRAIRPFFR